MKKLIAILLSLSLILSLSSVVLATPNAIVESMEYFDEGVTKTLTRTFYNPGTADEFVIVEIESPNSYTISDSRKDYIVDNGEKVYVYTSTITARGPRPTAIQHGLPINSTKWGYIKTEWLTKNFTDAIQNLSLNILQAAIVGCFNSGYDVEEFDFRDMSEQLKTETPTATSLYVRLYTYGRHGHLNVLGHITQLYTKNYIRISGSAAANFNYS